ncbi:phytase [Flavihumibacter solisilvae]|uniref:3-phytase n=1 Tax=Flavihumibacter solisilvae TaxID=1349421 RepID=A0A0C1L3L9_9BACT|nr:phytase [Flavihumibacter solisilvae]KIC94617.1 3-phytase [Flavihumibacter solisilvae]
MSTTAVLLRLVWITSSVSFLSCGGPLKSAPAPDAVQPLVVTEQVVYDTDDPAIWINSSDTSKSLVIGTDKETGGGLYAFDLHGKIVNKVTGLKRPNNVDIAYGVKLNGTFVDLAVVTERESQLVRFFTLPALEPADAGGIKVFAGEQDRLPMGVAVYKQSSDSALYVIVGRKSGPHEGYLWQYKLQDSAGVVTMRLARKFGKYSGKKEIESIAVDNELGYVYYSDEQVGIRKYYADPSSGNEELAMFGTGEFKEDNEGISIYKTGDSTGYILVSDQAANCFNIYSREGSKGDQNLHKRVAVVPVKAQESDGSELTSVSLPGFEGGLFVAMSTDKTFQYYSWKDLAKKAGLKTP